MQNDQFTVVNGRRIYHTAEGERRANYRVVSVQPMRSQGELLIEVQRIAAEEDIKRFIANHNHNHSNNNNPRVKNYDMPLSAKIAMRSLDLDDNNNKTTSLAKQTAADDEDNNVPDVQPKQVSISSTSPSVRERYGPTSNSKMGHFVTESEATKTKATTKSKFKSRLCIQCSRFT
jgi:hypothetical protein